MRFLVVAVLAFASARAHADASAADPARRRSEAPPVGTHRGQLELRSGFYERGVATLYSQYSEVELSLEIAAGGAVVLRARGRAESTTTITVPGSGEPRQNRWSIDDAWAGELVRTDGEPRLRLTRRLGEPARPPFVHELRCATRREPIDGRVTPVLRCDPATLRKGFPWNDPLPAYLRVPLVFALGGAAVRARVTVELAVGDEEPGPPLHVQLGAAR